MTTAKGWFYGSDNKKRYGLGNGKIANTFQKVGNDFYFFMKNSGLRYPKGWITVGSSKWWSYPDGKLAKGWTTINGNAYFFSSNTGKMVTDAVYRNAIYIPKNGNVGPVYGQAINILNKVGWSLPKAFNYAASTRYKYKDMRLATSMDYASYGFRNRYGNCYVMAGEFLVLSRLLGYQSTQVQGRIGAYLPHSWVEIKHANGTFVYDPDFTYETRRNGYKIYYGKSGTWRYTKYGTVREK